MNERLPAQEMPAPEPPAEKMGRREVASRAAVATAASFASYLAVGAATARAATAATDGANTWTAPQTIRSRGTDTSFQLHVQGYGHGVFIEQMHDWNGAARDTINIIHRSTGDGIFVAHGGGLPPSVSGGEGGNAAFNCLVPYYVDDFATGRGGSVKNTGRDTVGLLVAQQATVAGAKAIKIDHWGNDYGIVLNVQSPTDLGNPVPTGTGGPMMIGDWSPGPTLTLDKHTESAGAGALDVTAKTPSPVDAVTIRDANGKAHSRMRTDGTLMLTDANGTPWVQFNPDGQAWFGISPPGWGARLNIAGRSSGVLRALNFANSNGQAGDGAQIAFSDYARTYSTITATFDKTAPTHDGGMSFRISAADANVERMRADAAGLGFFGRSPAAQPKLTYSRRSEAPSLAAIRNALVATGLVADKTTP